ncbi:hypothetical protein [uncultured Thiodictyon sp.]|uniref:hypothetical protein n=1 Tax=uncultured Thiodictyon sp. TaxID=1846217 RepID=UPI0025E7F176|nr:hypothetical protein [uncultured Thiodictyon sp.]
MMADLPAYTAGILAGIPVTLLVLALAGTQRRAAAWSGALLGAWGLFGGFFAGCYWSPERLSGGVWGFEDVLFNAQMGVVVWTAGSLPWRHRLSLVLVPGALLRRAAALTLPMFAALLLAASAGVSPMTTVNAAALLVLVAGAGQPWRLGLAASGAVGYALIYLPGLWLLFALRPELPAAWTAGQPWTAPLLAGLPAGELAWATLCAAGHAVGFAWVAQARLAPVHARP